MKKSFWIGLAVGLTALVIVAAAGVFFAPPIRTVLASAIGGSGPWRPGGWGRGPGFTLPPELQGLTSIPAGQRFDHFTGAQVTLKDQNNHPLTVNVIPGKVTAASATSLTIAANQGGARTFTLNNQTMIHPMAAQTSTPTSPPAAATLHTGDDVVVVTLNDSTAATAVIAAGNSGFGWSGPGAWRGANGMGH